MAAKSEDEHTDTSSESGLSDTWHELNKSEYAKVIFSNLAQDVSSKTVGCEFAIVGDVQKQPLDCIGLFRVGEEDNTQCLASKTLAQIESDEHVGHSQCIFARDEIPEVNCYCQFRYVNSEGDTCGASLPFFVNNVSTKERSEDSDENSEDFVMVHVQASEEVKAKFEELENSKKELLKELEKESEKSRYLETSIQDLNQQIISLKDAAALSTEHVKMLNNEISELKEKHQRDQSSWNMLLIAEKESQRDFTELIFKEKIEWQRVKKDLQASQSKVVDLLASEALLKDEIELLRENHAKHEKMLNDEMSELKEKHEVEIRTLSEAGFQRVDATEDFLSKIEQLHYIEACLRAEIDSLSRERTALKNKLTTEKQESQDLRARLVDHQMITKAMEERHERDQSSMKTLLDSEKESKQDIITALHKEKEIRINCEAKLIELQNRIETEEKKYQVLEKKSRMCEERHGTTSELVNHIEDMKHMIEALHQSKNLAVKELNEKNLQLQELLEKMPPKTVHKETSTQAADTLDNSGTSSDPSLSTYERATNIIKELNELKDEMLRTTNFANESEKYKFLGIKMQLLVLANKMYPNAKPDSPKKPASTYNQVKAQNTTDVAPSTSTAPEIPLNESELQSEYNVLRKDYENLKEAHNVLLMKYRINENLKKAYYYSIPANREKLGENMKSSQDIIKKVLERLESRRREDPNEMHDTGIVDCLRKAVEALQLVIDFSASPADSSSAPQADCSAPAPQPDCSSPAPQPDCSSPAPQADCSSPAPQPDCSSPAPQPDCSSPAPQPDCSSAPQADCSSPAPQLDCSAPAPQADCSAPAPQADCSAPASDFNYCCSDPDCHCSFAVDSEDFSNLIPELKQISVGDRDKSVIPKCLKTEEVSAIVRRALNCNTLSKFMTSRTERDLFELAANLTAEIISLYEQDVIAKLVELKEENATLKESLKKHVESLKQAAEIYKDQYRQILKLQKKLHKQSKLESSTPVTSSTASEIPPSTLLMENVNALSSRSISDSDTGELVPKMIQETVESVNQKNVLSACSDSTYINEKSFTEEDILIANRILASYDQQHQELCNPISDGGKLNTDADANSTQDFVNCQEEYQDAMSEVEYIMYASEEETAEKDKAESSIPINETKKEKFDWNVYEKRLAASTVAYDTQEDDINPTTRRLCSITVPLGESDKTDHIFYIPCSMCDEQLAVTANSTESVKTHFLDVHKIIVCPICGQLFDSFIPKVYLNIHVDDHFKMNEV